MIVELHPKHPTYGKNVITGYSTEFADLITELAKKKDFPKIEGQFSIYRGKRGRIEIDLDMKKKEG